MIYQKALFPLLTLLEPEASHHLALRLLAVASRFPVLPAPPRVHPVRALGLEFPNPIGLAAGFDKNGVAVRALAALGFGHVEVGTVTPRPQPGKPKPRLFRLKEDQALINRLGFPSLGLQAVARNLEALKERRFVLGVNIGPNADSVGPADFVTCYRRLAPLADYVTVNVSSPNTAGLRDLALEPLLGALAPEAIGPVLVKLSPDVSDDALAGMLRVIRAHPFVSGIIATNTTVSRPPSLRGRHAAEAGGLSGPPLAARSTQMIAAIGGLPIVGVGGISSAESAAEKLAAGASLLQLYTGLIYEGPGLVRRLLRGV